ncbi:hypothetical protein [Luteimonas sp. RC10]|uniref:hypothetical protein n=1 Tax=Luteimonas sp. RC10 TaxID=2587035 RepID=UPI00160F8BD8|nr:hypothetical protein [Luteimonas sp. RC10]MBB3345272.1 hypothetical protein [Luteimonas sp. RC10]
MAMLTATIAGGLMGFGLINFMAHKAKSANHPWDVREFTADGDVLGRVDAWAAANGYKLRSDDGRRRVYQKGINILTAPVRLDVERDGNRYTTRSYVHVDGLLLKGDLALSYPGVMAKLPRANALKAQNQLLAELGQPPLA